ncbi:MAG TPA: T9SS type A sorting domain-containing protein [Bacteroidales bacterium]|nr:T9SS type A sorting domain-containing protein [Bacteroidales bacterium]
MIQRLVYRTTIVISLIISLIKLQAQQTERISPFAGQKGYQGKVQVVSLPKEWHEPHTVLDPDVPSPLPAGVVVEMKVVVGGDQMWQLDPVKKVRYWRTTFDFGQTVSVALYFDHFDPGKNGRLYLSGEDGEWKGAYTNRSSVSGQPFAIEPVRASRLILHFETGEDEQDFFISLSALGFLYDVKQDRGFGTSGPCEVNVNCSEGALWQNQKRGVVRILVRQGTALFYCTGSLINNTSNDGTPYLLTANHCGENSTTADYAQWVFSFNYESVACPNPLVEPFYRTLTGAELVSKAIAGTQSGSDFKLLKLLQTVPPWYLPYYNGWSRRNQISSSGVGIHHPDGDIKKISTFTTQPASSGYGTGGNIPSEKFWRLQWSATENGFGVTEGGSSGSPLFNSDGLITGVLTGGSSSCSNTAGFDFYGKFSYSWESNGSAAINQLRPWLDPTGTGQEVLQGLDSDPLFLQAAFTSARTEIAINQFVEFENTSGGAIETYEWSFPGGDPVSSNKENPGPILYRNYGNYDVQLVVKNPVRTDTLLRRAYVSVKPFVYPNPARGEFTISFGVDLTDSMEINIFDLFGREVSALLDNQGSKLRVSMPQSAKGLYLIKIRDRFVEKQLKVMILR